MSETGRGLRLLAFGLTIGALADLTLRQVPWGLNAAVVATALVAVILWQQADPRTGAGPGRIGYGVAVLAAAVGLAWRDATVLKVLDLVCIAVLLGLLASTRRGQAAPPSLTGYLLRITGTAAHGAVGTPLLVAQDVDWSEVGLGTLLRVFLAVGRGLAIAFPVLLVFTALLVNADPLFGRWVDRVFDVDVVQVLGHMAGIALAGYCATGLLRAAVVRARPAHTFPERPRWLALGQIEISLLLGLVDVLFAAFVWIQIRYLFGGEAWLHEVPGLTYSAYARRGFFELCAVTALVLPLLLVAHWLLRPETRTQARTFAILAGTQAVFVLVMLASAFERMRLYREEYGLTELRFYTTAIMLWLGVLLVVFMATVLRGRRDSFAQATLATAGLAVLLLHVADPDGWIVRTNAGHLRDFDVPYALARNADAVPSLLEVLPTLGPSQQCALVVGLSARWKDPEADWRTWNFARARAHRLVRETGPGPCPDAPSAAASANSVRTE